VARRRLRRARADGAREPEEEADAAGEEAPAAPRRAGAEEGRDARDATPGGAADPARGRDARPRDARRERPPGGGRASGGGASGAVVPARDPPAPRPGVSGVSPRGRARAGVAPRAHGRRGRRLRARARAREPVVAGGEPALAQVVGT